MKKFTLVTVLMLLSVLAFAQKPVRYGVYLGGTVPTGDLGLGDAIIKTEENPLGNLSNWAMFDENGKQGYAGIGGSLGFDVTLSLPAGFGVFAGVDVFVNSNCDDLRGKFSDWATQIEKEVGISSAKFNLPNVWNIPILFGVNYLHNFTNIVGIWGEVAFGPNFRMISDFKMEIKYTALQTDPETGYDYDVESITCDYESATTFGFKIGGGVMLWNRMSLGIDFYSLGKAKIKGDFEVKEGSHVIGDDVAFKGKHSMSSSEIVFRVGYHF